MHERVDDRVMRAIGATVFVLPFLIVSSTPSTAAAQDLEPRAYAASPVGVSFLAVVAGRSSGGVFVDTSLPVEDVRAKVRSLSLGVGRTFDLFGRTALAVAALPAVWADATGRVGEDTAQISRTGLADPRFKLSVNLLGGKALTAREFARASRPMIVGVSLSVIPPLGQYDPTRLINLGANRWSFKPEAGIVRALGRWTIEGYGGVWLFTTNDEFYRGTSIRTQDPVVALQLHGSYTFRPGLWLAVDGTWYSGGTTSVDGIEKADLQRNSRAGATVSLPLPHRQAIKITASAGTTTRIGADFRTIAAAWQLTWFR